MEKHIDEITPEELRTKQRIVQESFNEYIRVVAKTLNLCEGCTFEIIFSYSMFLAREAGHIEYDKPDDATEH